jgi:steroid 5-alpha reductase family enzyme
MDKSNFKKTLGFIFFGITLICWVGAPIIPFTDIPNKAIVTTTVVIVGEVFFVSAIALLEKNIGVKSSSGSRTYSVRTPKKTRYINKF